MVLSDGNADPECGFSQNKLIVSDLQCLLSQKLVVRLCAVKDVINAVRGSPLNVTITKPMLQAFRESSKTYREALEQQKNNSQRATQ